MMQTSLAGQAGVITGGGRGIGAATALELARSGVRLIIGDCSIADATPVVDSIRSTGGTASAIAGDVRCFADMRKLCDACVQAYDRIDVLIANAGIGDASSMVDGDPEQWRAVVETNVLGVAYAVRAALPVMREQRSGHIVLMASISGRETYVGEPLYIASKWAVVGLGHALRREARTYGIRVTLIEPGLVDTPLAQANPFAQQWLNTIEPLRAEDVARAVIYALSQPPYMSVSEVVLRPLAQEV